MMLLFDRWYDIVEKTSLWCSFDDKGIYDRFSVTTKFPVEIQLMVDINKLR